MAGRSDTTATDESSSLNNGDSLNPGDKHYQESLSGGTKNYEDSHGDTVSNNYNSEGEDSRSELEEQEKNGDSLYKQGGREKNNNESRKTTGFLRGKLNGIGPTGGIIGLIIFAIVGVGGGTSFLAGSLLINIKEIFHNDRSDGTRTNRIFSRATFANTFNGQKNCTGSKIKCKISTMSKSMVQNLKEKGYRLKGKIFSADGQPKGSYDSNNDTGSDSIKTPPENKGPTNGLADNESLGIDEINPPETAGGGSAKSGKEFFASVDGSPENTRLFNRVFNSKSAFYLNKFFSERILGGKFKFSKSPKTFPEDAKDEKTKEEIKKAQDKQFNEDTGGLSDSEKNGPQIKSKTDEVKNNAEEASGIKKSKTAGKGILSSAVQSMCSGYKLARGAITAVKIYQIAQLSKFALIFLQAADEIKDGSGQQSRVNYLSSNLTSYENNQKMTKDTFYAKKGNPNPKYNLSATDSQGYRVAAHGDTSKLAGFAMAYILGGSGSTTSKIDGLLNKMESPIGKITNALGITNSASSKAGGREAIKDACRIAKSGAINLVQACIGVTGGLTALSGAVSGGAGAPIGAVLGTAGCLCEADAVVQSVIFNNLPKSFSDFLKNVTKTVDPCVQAAEDVKQLAGIIMKGILEISDSWIQDILKEVSVGSDTKGVDAGNAIAAGVGLMLSTTATGYGLKPATKEGNNKEVTDYIAYTQPLEDQYIALEKADARQNPFDPSNQYSLIGSVVRAFNPASTATIENGYIGNIQILANLIPSAIRIGFGGQSANALYNQPSTAANGASGRYDCEDDDLAYINATGDKFCSIVGVSSIDELKTATDQAYNPNSTAFSKLVDYMTSSQVGAGGTLDPDNCALIDGSDDQSGCPSSKLVSIDDNGAPVINSQYDKYLHYCTDQREQPWGAQAEPYEQGSSRDQDWYSGAECTKNSTMLKNFRMWTNICLQIGTMNGSLNCYSSSSPSTTQSGDACSLLKNPNVILVQEGTKVGLKKICENGSAINSCGNSFTINQTLLNTITTLSSKYKIWLNNFGFEEDRTSCDQGQHPKGNAIDINGIEKLDGSGRAGGPDWGGITFSDPRQVNIISQYASDWLATLPKNRGGIGQKGCGGGSDQSQVFNPIFPAGSQNVNGAAFFEDSCDHLHIDIRDRGNLNVL